MTDENAFKASNGYKFTEDGGELLVYDKYGVFYTNITETLGDALREYFQRQRDHHLGQGERTGMTTEKTFKASNGITITISDEGYLTATKESGENSVLHATGGAEYGVQALREFFRHERDQELGRARWPENPDYVIYRDESEDDEDGRCLLILDERAALSWRVWENGRSCLPLPYNHRDAADWFFAEGPGKGPARPWEDAKEGEVWRLTIDGEEGNYLVKAGGEGPQYLSSQRDCFVVDHTRITAGRKLVNADGSPAGE